MKELRKQNANGKANNGRQIFAQRLLRRLYMFKGHVTYSPDTHNRSDDLTSKIMRDKALQILT